MSRYLLSVISLLAALPAQAESQAGYHLFNRAPANSLRDLSTDRPDKTESPITVDAGYFQLETDLLNYSHNRVKNNGENTSSRGYLVANNNIKAGLTHNIDIQFVVESFVYNKTKDYNSTTSESASGFGDVTTRLKWNLWGNDGGDTALALMPFIKFPTNQDNLGNEEVEGGLIVPLGVSLPHDFNLGLMTQINVNADSDGDGYITEYVNSITVSHSIIGNLSGFTELWTSKAGESGSDLQATFDMGLTYAIGNNVQLDAGVNLGLTESADDYNPFIGFSYRF